MQKTSNTKNDYRCPVCNRLLMKGEIVYIETKCPKCGKFVCLKDKAVKNLSV